MQLLLKEYNEIQIDSTLKWGRIICIFSIFFLLFYSYQDIYVFEVYEIVKWRMLSISLMLTFIIASHKFFIKNRQYIIPLYTLILSSILAMMIVICKVFLLSKNVPADQSLAATLGLIAAWGCMAFMPLGAKKHLLKISIVWAILFLITYIYKVVHDNVGPVLSIYLIAGFANFFVIQKDRADFKSFKFNRLLKEQEAKLIQQNQKISTQNEQLLTSNKLLENFAHSASHDLKEPLRTIVSFGGILKKDCKDKLDDNHKEYLDFMVNASNRMMGLVNGLMDFSKLKSFDFSQRDQVDLNDVLLIVQSNLSFRIIETNAQIQLGELPLVMGKSTLFIQLFQNLIANAIKFQDPDQKPIIIVDSKENEYYQIISVKDNGIGIPENQKDKVFEVFKRLNANNQYEGSGIGLATCKTIVEGFDGKIEIESTEGEGTSFHIFLPKVLQTIPSKELLEVV